jgi:hypothetical protein
MTNWKKQRRIHKRRKNLLNARLARGAAIIACMSTQTIDAYYTSWKWSDVTCQNCHTMGDYLKSRGKRIA